MSVILAFLASSLGKYIIGGLGIAAAVLAGWLRAKALGRKEQKAAQDAANLQLSMYQQQRQDQAPWRDAGTNALQQLTTLSGQFGHVPTAAEVMATPGYQFGLDQGKNALQGTAAAQGGLYSGKAGRDLTKYATDYATGQYNNAFNRQQSAENAIWNRYAGLAGIGQTATNQVGQAGQNYANNNSNILQGMGNAQGASAIANSNTYGGLANQLGSIGANWMAP